MEDSSLRKLNLQMVFLIKISFPIQGFWSKVPLTTKPSAPMVWASTFQLNYAPNIKTLDIMFKMRWSKFKNGTFCKNFLSRTGCVKNEKFRFETL